MTGGYVEERKFRERLDVHMEDGLEKVTKCECLHMWLSDYLITQAVSANGRWKERGGHVGDRNPLLPRAV